MFNRQSWSNVHLACVCTIDGYKEYLAGPIMISRFPTVHPGDARMVQAIGKPPDAPSGLTSLTNCVIFPCKGERSLPSMLAGGKLDGDVYCLVTDERLFPPIQYSPGSCRLPVRVDLDRPANADDVADFVVNYIKVCSPIPSITRLITSCYFEKNDLLEVIATQILLDADISPRCMTDPNCLQLAILHSDAVAFSKTGRPVKFHQLPKPKVKAKPDWFASKTVEINKAHSEYYQSSRHIGHLFRNITLPAVPEAKRVARRRQRSLDNTNNNLDIKFIRDKLLERDLHITRKLQLRMRDLGINIAYLAENNVNDIIAKMMGSYERYAVELSYLCKTHSLSTKVPLSEEEIVAGTIVAKCSQPVGTFTCSRACH
jgi:RNA-dependent RNA polymerase